MKKILLATTVLSMSAGFAAADVSVSGSARMGVVSTDGTSVFSSRVRMKFSGSGTTDGGLAFGGSFSAHDTAGANSGTAGSTYISGAFGKISMGDVDSGDKAAVGQIDGGVGYTGLKSFNSISYAADGGLNNDWEKAFGKDAVSAPGAKVLYTYSANGMSISASSSQIGGNASSYGVGASYSAGAVTVGLGYGAADVTIADFVGDEDDETDDISFAASATDVSASVAYTMGTTTVKAIYQDSQLDLTATDFEDVSVDYSLMNAVSTGVSVKNTNGALSLTGYAITTKFESDLAPGKSLSANRYGIGATYDLGGGATLGAGWVHNEAVAAKGEDSFKVKEVDAFDAGINFSF
ncbi:MAG: porin [Pseudomonadota bacterium]